MPRSPATTTSRSSISASKVSWLFVTLCSFTTYALSHNIGGSVFSGAVIRYRAYGTRGLTGQDVGVLVAICWITFVCRDLWPAGLVLVSSREIVDRFLRRSPVTAWRSAAGIAMLASSRSTCSAAGCISSR